MKTLSKECFSKINEFLEVVNLSSSRQRNNTQYKLRLSNQSHEFNDLLKVDLGKIVGQVKSQNHEPLKLAEFETLRSAVFTRFRKEKARSITEEFAACTSMTRICSDTRLYIEP